MGLLLQTTFETAQGISVSNPYCRIASVTYDSIGGGEFTITLRYETHVSRDRRLEGKQPISTPGLANQVSVRGGMGDMASLYARLKTHLEEQGFTAEDVLETPP